MLTNLIYKQKGASKLRARHLIKGRTLFIYSTLYRRCYIKSAHPDIDHRRAVTRALFIQYYFISSSNCFTSVGPPGLVGRSTYFSSSQNLASIDICIAATVSILLYSLYLHFHFIIHYTSILLFVQHLSFLRAI